MKPRAGIVSQPQSKPIPYARQSINEEDIQAVVEVLRSDWLTQGPSIARFEEEVAKYCGGRHAIAVSNGTAALHLTCLAFGLGPGKRLWTSPNTFVASANCALYCGAMVDFVDIDSRTYNLSVSKLKERLVKAERENTLPSVVVPVHFAGQPCEMEEISKLASRYRFAVIEDASHALGAVCNGEAVGNCAFSDAVVFSFHPVKIITTGEGGMILTKSEALRTKLLRLRTHGITREIGEMESGGQGPWYYEQTDLGYNYRLTDIQAALGMSQMKRLPQFLERRRELATRYDKLLEGMPITTPWQQPEMQSSWHLYVIRLNLDRLRKNHFEIFEALRLEGINVNLHYIPVHTQPYYRGLGFLPGQFPEAECYYKEAISLPMFPDLTNDEQDRVVDTLRRVIK